MIHPTYRRLDEPPRIGPFTVGQWIILVAITVAIFGVTRIFPLRTEYAVCLWLIACGIPTIAWVISEGDRPSTLRVIGALIRWALASKQLEAGAGHPRVWVLKVDVPQTDQDDLLALPSQTPDFPELTA